MNHVIVCARGVSDELGNEQCRRVLDTYEALHPEEKKWMYVWIANVSAWATIGCMHVPDNYREVTEELLAIAKICGYTNIH